MKRLFRMACIAGLALAAYPAAADEFGRVSRLTPHIGGMTVDPAKMRAGGIAGLAPRESLVFEPWQMLDELFRADIVFLMRHGPTDWSRRDEKAVEPTDCENQRVMTPQGQEAMRDWGVLLLANGIRPGRIVVSEWCRNQQTVSALRDGFATIDPEYAATLEIVTDPAANLLLSLRGAATVTELRRIISEWDGKGGAGPLLLVSHFTNIAELTEFNIYEGEALVLDPKRDNRVLGYIRLRSAGPDVGHFAVAVEPQ